MTRPGPDGAPEDRGRSPAVVYLLIALAAFLAGMAFGQLGAPRPGARSRIDWPAGHPAP